MSGSGLRRDAEGLAKRLADSKVLVLNDEGTPDIIKLTVSGMIGRIREDVLEILSRHQYVEVER